MDSSDSLSYASMGDIISAISCCGFATEREPSPASACCWPSSIPGRSRPIPRRSRATNTPTPQLNEWILAWVAHQLPRAPAAPLRRQHLLSGARLARLLRTADRPGAHGRPAALARGLAGARLQHPPDSGLRADRLGRLRGGVRVDGRSCRRDARRVDVRVQHPHADAPRAHPRHPRLGIAADPPLGRPHPRPRALAGCRVAGRLDDGDGVHLRLPHRVRRHHGGGHRDGASRGLVGRVPGRIAMLFAGATLLSAIAVLPVYLPYRRVAKLGMVRPIETVSRVLRQLERVSRHRRAHPLRDVEQRDSGRTPSTRSSPGSSSSCWRWPRSTGRSVARDDGTPSAHSWLALTRRRIVMLVAIAVTGVLLSLGTRTPVYGWVYQVFPPMQGLRAAARFGNLFLLAMAVLAAFGLAGLRRRLPTRWAGLVVVGLVVAREHRVAPRALSLHALRGHSEGVLAAGERAGTSRPGGGPVLSAARRVRERRIRAQLHRALAAADERLQRLHPRHVSRVRRRRSGTSRGNMRSRRCGAQA